MKVYEDMVEVLLVLEIFLTEDSQVEDLLSGAPSCSEACLSSAMIFFVCSFNLFSILQHDFARVADETDRAEVLALLQIAFLGKCDDRRLSPRDWPFSWLPDLDADSSENNDYFLPGPVLLGCCQLQLTSLSPMIV